MGLFDFAGSVGTSLSKAIGLGDDDASAKELAKALPVDLSSGRPQAVLRPRVAH